MGFEAGAAQPTRTKSEYHPGHQPQDRCPFKTIQRINLEQGYHTYYYTNDF